MPKRYKIIISGTGRAGTSYLVYLFTLLGLDTGFSESECVQQLSRDCRAGLELPVDAKNQVIKSMVFAQLPHKIPPDTLRVIIPIRELKASAQSREAQGHGKGGYWLGCENIEQQEITNAILLYNLVYHITIKRLPFQFIEFPRMVNDFKYLREKLHWMKIDVRKLKAAYDKITNPELVSF